METQHRLWTLDVKDSSKCEKRKNVRGKQFASKKRDAEKINKSNSSMELSSRTNGKPKDIKVNCSKKTPKFPPNSLGHVDSRLSSSMQVIGHHVRRDLGSASSTRSLRDRPPLQRRSHTSLGFTWNTKSISPHSSSSLHNRTQGFDIRSYVKRCGTARGIQIGVNGRPVDMDMYLGKGDASSDSEEDVDVNYLRTVSEGDLGRHRVPLCWEEQLELAEPNSILCSDRSKREKRVVIIQDKNNEEDCKKKFEVMISKLLVTLSWKENCVLESTPLSELNPSLTLPADMTGQNFASYERVDVLSPSLLVTENQVAKSKSSTHLKVRMNNPKLEEPVTPVIDVMSEFSSSDLLGIWFNTADGATQKELIKLSFDVFVTATETVDQNLVELSTKAFTKLSPQVVSKTVSVIPVHLCNGETLSEFVQSGELKLTVICDAPRSMLFSTRINLSSTYPLLESQAGGSASFSPMLCPSPRNHHLVGSLDVPEHYCKRRSSYCNQEDDEDKTDLESLSRIFPELKILEYEDSPSSSGNKPNKPTSLPLHEDDVMKPNTMTVTIKRTPLRLSPAPEASTPRVHFEQPAVTDWTTYQRLAPYHALQSSRYRPEVSNSSRYALKDFARRPLFRPVTQQDLKSTRSKHSNTGYASIVSSHLTPYMK